MPRSVPERLRWAVETMAIDPDDRLLEIGCGRGVAVSLVCEVLSRGKIIAIDRSTAMVKAAERRNVEHVTAGRAVFRTTTLEDADLDDRPFDKVFAVNVNLFWVPSSTPALDRVRRSLKPGGAMYLFYEPPEAARALAIADRVTAFLIENGFSSTTLTTTTKRSSLVVCLLATPNS